MTGDEIGGSILDYTSCRFLWPTWVKIELLFFKDIIGQVILWSWKQYQIKLRRPLSWKNVQKSPTFSSPLHSLKLRTRFWGSEREVNKGPWHCGWHHEINIRQPSLSVSGCKSWQILLIQRLRVIWGQCCQRVAAGTCLPNGPITQLSPYLTQNPCS